MGFAARATSRENQRMFDDLLDANRRYAERFALADLAPRAARGLALVTCIDSRIEPLQMLGLVPGDAKIMRNAGGRVTDDVLRSLILAANLLSVDRVAVMHHTECAVASPRAELVGRVEAAAGRSSGDWDFLSIVDPDADLADDVAKVRGCPLLPPSLPVVGWRYDIRSGLVVEVVPLADA
jgi:carbonic anhydrase